jgi:hypothetical protein
MMEAVCTYDTSAFFKETTRRYIPENGLLQGDYTALYPRKRPSSRRLHGAISQKAAFFKEITRRYIPENGLLQGDYTALYPRKRPSSRRLHGAISQKAAFFQETI